MQQVVYPLSQRGVDRLAVVHQHRARRIRFEDRDAHGETKLGEAMLGCGTPGGGVSDRVFRLFDGQDDDAGDEQAERTSDECRIV